MSQLGMEEVNGLWQKALQLEHRGCVDGILLCECALHSRVYRSGMERRCGDAYEASGTYASNINVSCDWLEGVGQWHRSIMVYYCPTSEFRPWCHGETARYYVYSPVVHCQSMDSPFIPERLALCVTPRPL